jgi:transcriptional regulator with GAF, ATPase, and Fis domain
MNKDRKLIGKSPEIKSVLFFIEKATKSASNVLGETGVGKEITARAIHDGSYRKDKPFVKINCGNLNDNLLESELFGHQKGAFTGAYTDKPGLIESANGGTFFFDEIADVNPYIQAKLLSVIEDKEIRRIGENNLRKIDTRFIFATNKDLYSLVMKGKFRQDLFYRVNILAVFIPPLRERKEDIPLLIEAILKRERPNVLVDLSITKEAINKICNYLFPGNVRELENILKRACELSSHNIIKENDICFQQTIEKSIKRKGIRFPINKIVDVLIKCKGNKTKAARQLGISRRHLYRLLSLGKNS